jgi:hypothetical protein
MLLILLGALILRSAIHGFEPSLPYALDITAVRKRITTLERIGYGLGGAYIVIEGISSVARNW